MVLLWLAIEPHTSRDREKLVVGLQHLMADDRSLAVKSGADGTVMIGAPDEDQLDAVVHQLVDRFGVEAAVKSLEVAYKETLTVAADGNSKHLTRHRPYAHVKLRVEPGALGSGCVFEHTIAESAIPKQMIAPIEEGISEVIDRGVLAGYPIDDIRVIVYDGSYHAQDFSPAAFKLAGRLAFTEAARRAKPVLLEPIMRVSVVTPPQYESRVFDGLRARGARFQIFGERAAGSDTMTISTLAPLARMFGYGPELRARTDRQGTFTMTFSHYAPAALSEDDGDRAADVTAPLHPRRPPLILRASVPEPGD